MDLRTAALAALFLLCAACAAVPGPGAADFDRIHAGMTQEEARRVLGVPHETMRFDSSRTVSWDYRLTDPWGYLAMYSVIFAADGTVERIVTQRLNDGGDHS